MKNKRAANKVLIFSVIFSLMASFAFNSVFAATEDDIANIENKIVNIQNEINQLSELSESKISNIKEEAQRQKDELLTKLNEIPNDGTAEQERNNLMAGIENLEKIISSADNVDFSDPSTYQRFINEVNELNILHTKTEELAKLREELDEAKKTLDTSQETSKETPKETEKETPKETPKETIKETPKETIKETPKETSKETPSETSKETIKESPKETIKETIKETKNDNRVETTKETEEDKPSSYPSQGNNGSNDNNNNNSKVETPINKQNTPIMVGSLIDSKIFNKIIDDKRNNIINNPNNKDNISTDSDKISDTSYIGAEAKVENPETSDNFDFTLMGVLLVTSVIGLVVIQKNKNKM
ncbi:hypothetical protein GUI37_06395 [Helcococcus kunzii]|uniref:hypothetical protein n=1 Tax=Helcococcus kunzii TaxID=40091 RepID=UPI001BAF1943|nr:hypothetical protein [Helcococcus kunzii]QUY65168.1 hypothetical protein GUI37_06395 [Helcococcus kunzii]